MRKRLLSMILVLAMLTGMAQAGAAALEPEQVSGSTGAQPQGSSVDEGTTVQLPDGAGHYLLKDGTATVDPVDFGADPSGKEDSAEAIWRAFEAAKQATADGASSVVISFPTGEYHIYKDRAQQRVYHTSNTNSTSYPTKYIGLLLEDQENVTMEGNGSLFMMHGNMMALAVVRSENVKLQNFSWDFAVPTISEMTVLDAADGYVDYYIPASCPFEISGNTLRWVSDRSPYTGDYYWTENGIHNAYSVVGYNPEEEMTRAYQTYEGPFQNVTGISNQGGGVLRFTYSSNAATRKSHGIVNGAVFQFASSAVRETAGAFFWESSDLVAENIDVHSTHGFGWLTQMCRNVTYRGCNFMPREGTGRATTSYADGLHASGASGNYIVENCNFANTHDDPINLHGTFTRVEQRVDDNTLVVKYIHAQQGGFPQFHVGDKVQFFTRDTLESTDGENEYTVAEIISNPGEGGNDLKTMRVKFAESLPSNLSDTVSGEPKYVAENVTYAPTVTIRGCTFKGVTTRGILVTTRNPILIENNTFLNMSMATIYLSNDSGEWYESGPIRDMTVRNNTFYIKSIGRTSWEYAPAIYFHPVTKNGGLPSADNPIHKNINIDGNTFYMDLDCVVKAESVENLSFTNNKVLRYHPDVELTITPDKSGLTVGETASIGLTATGNQNTGTAGQGNTPNNNYDNLFEFTKCKNVTISGNTYDDGLKLTAVDYGNNQDLKVLDPDIKLTSARNTDAAPAVQNVAFASSDPEVVRVDTSGGLTALKPGTATVFAYYNWNGSIIKSNEQVVTVTGQAVENAAVSITTADNLTLSAAEETQTYAADAAPEGTSVTWSVEAPQGGSTDVAVMDPATGILTAKRSGVAVVRASAGGASDVKTVIVSIPTAITAPGVSITRGDGTWSAEGNGVTIPMKTGDLFTTTNTVPNLFLIDLPAGVTADDLITSVHVTGLPISEEGKWNTASFLLYDGDDNYVTLGKKSHFNGFTTVREVSAAGVETGEGGTGNNSVSEATLLFSKSGGTVQVFGKAQGASEWTTLTSLDGAFLSANLKVGFACWGSPDHGNVTFTDLRIGKASENTDKDAFVSNAPILPVTVPNTAPAASGVSLGDGPHAAGQSIEATYTYADPEGQAENGSLCLWTMTATDGAVTRQFTIGKSFTPSVAGTLTCTVYPRDSAGMVGAPVTSGSAAVTAGAEDYTLRGISFNGSPLKGFDGGLETGYAVSLPAGLDKLTVTLDSANPSSGTTVITLGGTEYTVPNSGGAVVELPTEGGELTVRRIKENTAQKTYTFTLSPADSRTALSAISISELSFTQENPEPGQFSYYTTAETTRTSVTLSVTKAAAGGTVSVTRDYARDGVDMMKTENVYTAQVPLYAGLNSFYIDSVAADGVTRERHVVNVVRCAARNADLSALTVNGAPLSGFGAATLDYQLNLDSADFAVAATAADTNAHVALTVNGVRAEASQGTYTLVPGLNKVRVSVQADDAGAAKVYGLNVVVNTPENASLLTLELEGAQLSPGFDPDITGYTTQCYAARVTLRATAQHSGATITLTGNSQPDVTGTGNTLETELSLYGGDNEYALTVTAPNGSTTKTYRLTLQAEDMLYLSDLGWSSAVVGYGTPKKDTSCEGTPLKLATVENSVDSTGAPATYAKGIGGNAEAIFTFDLSGKGFTRFQTYVGVDYANYNAQYGSIQFQVFLDSASTAAFDSGVMTQKTPQKYIDLDVTGVNTLTLKALAGENEWNDHADWADAKLLVSLPDRPTGTLAVTVEEGIANGELTVDKTLAGAGDKVTVTAHPATGYRLKAGSLNFFETGREENTTAVSGNSFTMPDYPVTVTAEFEAVPLPEAASRLRLNFNQGWKFTRGEVTAATAVDYPLEELELWEGVSLPHTVRLEGVNYSGNVNYQGKAMYRKHFFVPEEYRGQKIFVEFEAAMGVSNVWVNGTHVQSPIAQKTGADTQYGGYLPFILDLTELVKFGGGENDYNVITVMVDNSDNTTVPPGKPQDGLDYTYMGGIYRNAWMDVVSPVHITNPNYEDIVAGGGVLVDYPAVSSSSATVDVKTHVRNEDAVSRSVAMRTQIKNREGVVVASESTEPQVIAAGEAYSFAQALTVTDPHLWNLDDPYLHTLVSSVLIDGVEVDRLETTIGIRRIEVSTAGVKINGEAAPFLSGVNRHQDYPYIGFAASSSLQRRDAVKFKEAGFNIVRTAHAPHSVDFLNACDELGILVLESIPGWQHWSDDPKFAQRVNSDMQQMIRRDRNHPSIIMFEISLNESPGVPADFINNTNDAAKLEHPSVITSAENPNNGANSDVLYGTPSEVAGWSNTAASLIREYADYWIEQQGDFATECRVTRGPGTFYPGGEARMVNQANRALWTGYPNFGTGSLSLAQGLKHYQDSNHRFIAVTKWIGIDHNRGYSNSMSPCGLWDLMRIPKYMYYAYASQRPIETDAYLESLGVETGPLLFVASSWSETAPALDKGSGTLGTDEARSIYVYSNAAKVKLSVIGADGTELWTATQSPATRDNAGLLAHAPFEFLAVPYTAGSYLKAEGLTAEGTSISGMAQEVHTAGAPAKLRLVADYENTALVADGSDAVMVYAYVEDENGTLCQTATDLITFSVEGPATIIGDGNLRTGANPVKAEAGIIGVYIQSAKDAGEITVTASAKGLTGGAVTFISSALQQPTVPYVQIADNGQGDTGTLALTSAQGVVVGEEPNNTNFTTGNKTAGGTAYPDSIEVRNMAMVEYDLSSAPGFTRLVGKVALGDPTEYQDGAVFKVYTDGVLRYASPRVTTDVLDIDVDITGVEKLTLVGEDANGVNTSSMLWLTPTLVQGVPTLPDDSELRQNLAQGKTAAATSSQIGMGAEFAVDGSSSTGWHSGAAVAEGRPQSLTVDLGAPSNIRNARVGLAYDYFKYSYTISVAADANGPWTVKATTSKTGHASNEIDVFTAGGVRYVKVEFTKIESAQGHGPDQLFADIIELELYRDLGVASVDEFNLKGLEVAGNDLVLNPVVTEYAVTPQSADGELYLRVLPADPSAAVAINGTEITGLSGKTDLRDVPFSAYTPDGEKKVAVTVTAAGGAEKTYTLTVGAPAAVSSATAAMVPGINGANGWSYGYQSEENGGTGGYACGEYTWKYGSWTYSGPRFLHPDTNPANWVTRTYTAPREGTLHFSAKAAKYTGQDGAVWLKVLKNGTKIWPADGEYTALSSTTPIDIELDLSVVRGDKLQLALSCASGGNGGDATCVVSSAFYQGALTPDTFTILGPDTLKTFGTDALTQTYTLEAKAGETTVPGYPCTWKLTGSVAGVSIDAATGVLTVESGVTAATVEVQATTQGDPATVLASKTIDFNRYENLALGKTATADATGDASNDPSKAVDGDPATLWHPGGKGPHWWQVDLGKVYQVEEVNLTFAWDPGQVRHKFDIEGSIDGANWSVLESYNDYAAGGTPVSEVTLPLDDTVRYLKVSNLHAQKGGSEEWVELGEFSVIGASAASHIVTLTPGTGYTLAAAQGSVSPVEDGGSFAFTLTLSPGYTQSTPVVKANGTHLTTSSHEGAVYTYTISNITANQTVTVDALTLNVYTVTFKAAGAPDSTKKVTHGGTLTRGEFPAVSAKNGYTGVWEGTEDLTNVVSDQTVNAVYTAETYTITYELDGGDATNPGSYTIETDTFTLNNPTKTGHTFLGWTGTGLTQASKTVTISKGSTGNRTYTATYEIISVTAKKITSVNTVAPITVAYGTAQSAIGLPATVGVTFDDNSKAAIGVTWTSTPTYSATTPGKYVFTGTLATGPDYDVNGKTAACTVTVEAKPATVPVAPGKPGVAAGDGQLTVTWTAPADGGSVITGYSLKCNGETKPVGNVTEYTLTGLTNGTEYTISVAAINAVGTGGYSIPETGTPSKETVSVTGVTLNRNKLELLEGNTATLTAAVLPDDATNKSVTWSSDDTDVATVDASGLVSALSDGTAIITVTTVDGKFTAECTVTVETYEEPHYNPPSNTTTKTEKNEDGSTTRTVTNKKTGAVTETTTYPDGTKIVAATPKDGETSIEVTVPKNKETVIVTIPTSERPKPGEVAVIVHEDGTKEIVKASVATEDGMKVLLSESCKLEIMDNSRTFTDVASDHWAADAVQFAASRELFTGTGADTFSPAAGMTRGMLMTVLARLDGQDTTAGDTWYSAGMEWAKEREISDGTAPEAEITRESLAVMLYRYAGNPEIDESRRVKDAAPYGEFADVDSVSGWAGDAMLWAVESGILQGSGNKLNPGGTATRAEVAAMLQRFIAL